MIDFVKNEIKLYLQHGNGGNSVNVSFKNVTAQQMSCGVTIKRVGHLFIKEQSTWM